LRWQLPSSKCDHPTGTEVYQQILAAAQQQRDIALKETTLKMIAELHLSWFEYPKAAAIYEELLGLAKANQIADQVIYLQPVYIYERAKQYQPAVTVNN